MQRKWYICRGSVQSHPTEWKKNQRRGRCWSRRYRRRCIKRAADSSSPFATTTMAEAYVHLKRSHDDNSGEFYLYLFLFCSLAVLDPTVGHTMNVFSPFIPVLCHSDWLFHGESYLRLDDVHPRLRIPDIVPCIISFSLVSSWCASFLALMVPSLLMFCSEPTHLFSLLFTNPAESF